MKRSYGDTTRKLVMACQISKIVSCPDKAVLVCDDDPSFVQVAMKRLNNMGKKVMGAMEVSTAKKYLDEYGDSIGVVVADYWIGDGTGLDLIDYAMQNTSVACFLVSGDAELVEEIRESRPTVVAFHKENAQELISLIGA